jgi:uncharacterized protein YlxP (DUF503 family)
MIVGVLTVEVAIFEAQSLKDKRRVIQSVKQKLRNRFNVSVSEVGHGDSPKRCLLGVVTVSNESRQVHSAFDKIVDMLRRLRGITLLEYKRELL